MAWRQYDRDEGMERRMIYVSENEKGLKGLLNDGTMHLCFSISAYENSVIEE